MAQAMVNFRMDEDLKKEMDSVCKDMGLTATAAYTIFAKKVTQEKRIPFEIVADPFYSDSNQQALRQSMQQIKDGKTVTTSLDELKAMEA